MGISIHSSLFIIHFKFFKLNHKMHIRDITSDIDAIDAYPAFITRDYFIKNFGVINDPTRSSTSVKSLGHLRVKQRPTDSVNM